VARNEAPPVEGCCCSVGSGQWVNGSGICAARTPKRGTCGETPETGLSQPRPTQLLGSYRPLLRVALARSGVTPPDEDAE
jgi:hypothetical protein